ncbi:PGAP1-like alpha/beta domain-containing protein [Williamsia soli]|uniref:PGAP1-like alpha/beta domain-containing protein n=1 Tax=Williamsia soli TaxID=364929 RepID=UPI001A9E7BBD|nr:lipase [Williamsia soli]
MKTKAYLTRMLSAVVLLIAVGSLSTPAASAGGVATGERIVVLVPGQQATPGTTSRDQYRDMAAELTAQGYTVHTVDVKGLDLPADTRVVKAAVARATAGADVESVAIVGHSYGGLSARSYLKTLGGSDLVDTYIAIGTPQYGSPGGCAQLPGFGWDGCPVTPFIADLVAGDDTPGDTAYYSIRSDEELADGRLDGGQYRVAPIPDLVHEVEPADPRVIAAVSEILAGHSLAEFVDEAEGDITLEKTLFPAPTR